jgi:DNA-binding MarR family transcriptional regulator
MSTPERPDPHVVYRQYMEAVVLHGQASAEATGLHTTDLYALSALSLAGSLTSGELSERTGLTTGATTRLIDRLERGGHVRRVADPADRRRVVIEPVANPSLDVDTVVGPARRHIADILASYTPE